MNVEKAIEKLGDSLKENGTPFVLMASTEENTIVYMGATGADQFKMGNKWINGLKKQLLDSGMHEEFVDLQLKLMMEDEKLFELMMFLMKAKHDAMRKAENDDDAEDEPDDSDDDTDEDEDDDAYSRVCPETAEEKARRKAIDDLINVLRGGISGHSDFSVSLKRE